MAFTSAEQQALVMIRAVREQIASGKAPKQLSSPARLAHYVITAYHGHAELRMSRLAPALGASMRTLQRSFQMTFSTSMKTYQVETRLKFAQYLLSADPSLKISALAKTLGYDDPNVFERFFQKQTNASPGAWAAVKAGVRRSDTSPLDSKD